MNTTRIHALPASRYGQILLILFLASYGLFLRVLRPERAASASMADAVLLETRSLATHRHAAIIDSVPEVTGQGSEPRDDAHKPAAWPMVSAQALLDIEQLRETATSADEDEERLRAIQELAAVPTSSAVQALTQVLHEADDFRQRSAAILSLGKLATHGDPQHRIQDILKEAIGNQDISVSANAQDAYIRLAQRQ
ncbi:MAG: HEAT repeat domain-containing protein [Steroidobacteraceae bacterium]